MTATLIRPTQPLRRLWQEGIALQEELAAAAAGELAARGLTGPAAEHARRTAAVQSLSAAAEARRWGKEAEEHVLQDILAVLGGDVDRWTALRSVLVPQTGGAMPLEADLLLVGPCGIVIAETKAWRSPIELGPRWAFVGRSRRGPRTSPLWQLRRLSFALRQALARAGMEHVPLLSAVCLPWATEAPALHLPKSYRLLSRLFWGQDAGRQLAEAALLLPRTWPATAEAVLRAIDGAALAAAA